MHEALKERRAMEKWRTWVEKMRVWSFGRMSYVSTFGMRWRSDGERDNEWEHVGVASGDSQKHDSVFDIVQVPDGNWSNNWTLLPTLAAISSAVRAVRISSHVKPSDRPSVPFSLSFLL